MVLTFKFNDSFKDGQASDLMLGLYMSDAYGSNSFDFAKAARIATPTNDYADVSPDLVRKAILNL